MGLKVTVKCRDIAGAYQVSELIIIISIFVERHKVVTSEVLAAVGCVC